MTHGAAADRVLRCPRCEDTDLDQRMREGVSIDVCPSCRGVWLDRGELEKVAERLARRGREEEDDDDDDHGDEREFGRSADDGRRRSRGERRGGLSSLLGSLFD